MSIATYLTALDRDRDALAANLVTKGVQASSSETFTTLVPKVLNIPSGGGGIVDGLTFKAPNLRPQTVSIMDKPFGWNAKTWSGLTNFNGCNVWSDGTDIYYSSGSNQYVLDKTTSTWSSKTWTGLTNFNGYGIWTDGTNIYYSSGAGTSYVLDKSTSTWTSVTGTGITGFVGYNVWTDGTDIYYSAGSYQYVYDKATSTWSTKTWNNSPSNFYGQYIWTDGTDIYLSYSTNVQYVLDKATSTWSSVTFNFGLGVSTNVSPLTNLYGYNIWTDGINIYYSYLTSAGSGNGNAYITLAFEKTTKTWYPSGPCLPAAAGENLGGSNVWTDGTNIYYSRIANQFVLQKPTGSTQISRSPICKPVL